jgi:hypothetical protein
VRRGIEPARVRAGCEGGEEDGAAAAARVEERVAGAHAGARDGDGGDDGVQGGGEVDRPAGPERDHSVEDTVRVRPGRDAQREARLPLHDGVHGARRAVVRPPAQRIGDGRAQR